jgi:hypothetical protein
MRSRHAPQHDPRHNEGYIHRSLIGVLCLGQPGNFLPITAPGLDRPLLQPAEHKITPAVSNGIPENKEGNLFTPQFFSRFFSIARGQQAIFAPFPLSQSSQMERNQGKRTPPSRRPPKQSPPPDARPDPQGAGTIPTGTIPTGTIPTGTMSGDRKLEILHSAIELMAKRIAGENIPLAMRDLTRLIRLESEMSGLNGAGPIEISWVSSKQSAKQSAKEPAIHSPKDANSPPPNRPQEEDLNGTIEDL